MSSRSILLLRFKRIFHINNKLVTRHFLHEKPTLPQQSRLGFYSVQNRNFHNDLAPQQEAAVKEKIYSSEVNRQIPIENVRFVEYQNLFAFDVLKEKPEYNYYQSIALMYKDSFIGFEPNYLASSPASVEGLLENIDDFNFSQILSLLNSLILHTPFKTKPHAFESLSNESNFWLITKQLDQCCLRMLNTMSPHFDQSKDFLPFIAMANLWYELGLAKHSPFIRILVKKLCEFQEPLCDYSYLQLMFFINLQRDFNHKHWKSIIKKTKKYLREGSSVSTKDLTLVAMGYFQTRTPMPGDVLGLFMDKCLAEFSDMEKPNFTMSISSILKAIRYSYEASDHRAEDLRRFKLTIKQLVDAILRHPEQYINSSIVASDLLQLLTTAQLQDQTIVYNLVFDKMIENLDNMRIKDIERVMFGMANAMLTCNNLKLKTVEDFVCNSMDAQLYPIFVYNLYSYLRIMGYYPKNLLRLMQKPEFLQLTIDTSKEDCYDVLILNDTILRLLGDSRSPTGRLLTDEQVANMRAPMFANYDKTGTSKRARFLRSIRDVLQPEYGSALKFIYLLPFSPFPFPVILDEKAQKIIEKYQSEGTMTERIEPPSIDGDDVIPYNPELCTPNLFEGSTAIQILSSKDYISGDKIRGFTNMNTRLLEALGLKVLQIDQSY